MRCTRALTHICCCLNLSWNCQNPNSTISSIQLSLRLDYILTQRSTPPTTTTTQTLCCCSAWPRPRKLVSTWCQFSSVFFRSLCWATALVFIISYIFVWIQCYHKFPTISIPDILKKQTPNLWNVKCTSVQQTTTSNSMELLPASMELVFSLFEFTNKCRV